MGTRLSTTLNIYGQPVELPQHQLPTNGDIMRLLYFEYNKMVAGQGKGNSSSMNKVADTVVEKISEVYKLGSVGLKRRDKVKGKVLKLYEDYKKTFVKDQSKDLSKQIKLQNSLKDFRKDKVTALM